ncbi:hypothetical protein [Streptomyces albidoflavus]|uniref:hypothetical protein n=1 Tax=Streptomyces albidoflavus TaxID=1886 RepID=UPI00340B2B49
MSTAYSHTYFIDGRTQYRSFTAVNAALMVEPDGIYAPSSVSFQIGGDLTPAEKAEVAERFAVAVTSWATELRAQADGERTTADELAAAKAEIERLRAEQGGAA